MNQIKKGDIVGRISYGKDILFVVERIITTTQKQKFVILKGLTVRIQADSPIEDLELIETKRVEEHVRNLEEKLTTRIQKYGKKLKENVFLREKTILYTGKILHIDGDRKYSEKSSRYYKKLGLTAIVKNIPERKQASYIANLLQRYKPDILVVTGHDRNDKKRHKI